MQNTVIGGLLLFGGIMVSLGNNKARGTILLLTLLLIVSISILISLQPANSEISNEYFEGDPQMPVPNIVSPEQSSQQQQLPQSNSVSQDLSNAQQQLPMPLTVQTPTPLGSDPTKQSNEMTAPPNPPFNKILGRADNTIESVKFYDTNNNILQSGKSQLGKEFSYECPAGSNIVGYDFNNEGNERDDSSILGGLGPVYCADGTVLNNTVGKQKNASLGQVPKLNPTNMNPVDNKV